MMKKFLAGFVFSLFLFACSPSELPGSQQTTPTASQPPTETRQPTQTATPSAKPSPTAAIFVRDGTPLPPASEAISVENVGRIAELARWGDETIMGVLLNGDKQIAFIQTVSFVRAYPMGMLEPIWEYESSERITAMAPTIGNDMIALGTFNGRIVILDVGDGREIMKWRPHTKAILSLDLSSNGVLLASSSEDHTAQVWKVDSEELLASSISKYDFTEVFFVANETSLAMQTRDKKIGLKYVILSLETNRLTGFEIKNASLFSVHPNKNRFVHIDWEALSVRDFEDNFLVELEMVEEVFYGWGPRSFAFSNDGTLMAMGLEYGRIAVWDIEDGGLEALFEYKPIAEARNPGRAKPSERTGPGQESIYSVAFHPNGNSLVAVNGFGEMSFWDLRTKHMISEGDSLGGELQVSGDGQIVLVTAGRVFDYYSIPDLSLLNSRSLLTGEKIFFSDFNHKVAYGSSIWETLGGDRIELPHGERIISLDAAGETMINKARGWNVRVRSVGDMRLRAEIDIEFADLIWLASDPNSWTEIGGWGVSPDGTRVFAAGYETPLFGWSMATGELEFSEGMVTPSVLATFSDSGDFLVVYGEWTETIAVFNKSNGGYEHLYSFGLEDYSSAVSISRDDKFIIVGTQTSLYFYEMQTGELVKAYRSLLILEEESIQDVVQSPINDLVVFSGNNLIYLFDPSSDEIIYTISVSPYKDDLVRALAFSPDGRFIAADPGDGTLHLWGIPD